MNVVDGVAVRLGEIATVRDGPGEVVDHTWIRFAGELLIALGVVVLFTTLVLVLSGGYEGIALQDEAEFESESEE